MNHKDYKREVIERLLKKWNNRIRKNISTNRRVILKPTEVYKKYADYNADITEKQNLHEAVKTLLDMEVIAVDYLKFSVDIEKIYLCEDKLDVIYEYLKEEYGIIPRSIIQKQIERLFQNYECGGKLVQDYCSSVLLQLAEPGNQINPERVEKNLKMLAFIEKNEESLYIREASMLVYGDSKWFEENNCEEVCNAIRDSLDMPKEESERNDAVLAGYYITPMEQEIFIKGDWKIEWEDYVLETVRLKGGIAIASNDIQGIQKITVSSPQMMTIENKTSYQRMNDSDTAAMYLGGFANRHQILFLQKVILDNPDIRYYHFGDIDVGGFLIHRHLCRATGIDFKLYGMGLAQLLDKRFEIGLRQLTENDRSRMNLLLEEEKYRPIVEYMGENNVKLEQEIVSYYIFSCKNGKNMIK